MVINSVVLACQRVLYKSFVGAKPIINVASNNANNMKRTIASHQSFNKHVPHTHETSLHYPLFFEKLF